MNFSVVYELRHYIDNEFKYFEILNRNLYITNFEMQDDKKLQEVVVAKLKQIHHPIESNSKNIFRIFHIYQ